MSRSYISSPLKCLVACSGTALAFSFKEIIALETFGKNAELQMLKCVLRSYYWSLKSEKCGAPYLQKEVMKHTCKK
jgi:hypothetical protein